MHHNKKVVFITGCAQGIGNYLTSEFLHQGYAVIATDIDFEKLKSVMVEDKDLLLLKLNVCDEKEWCLALNTASNVFGKIDILINNAGIIRPSYISDLIIGDIKRQPIFKHICRHPKPKLKIQRSLNFLNARMTEIKTNRTFDESVKTI